MPRRNLRAKIYLLVERWVNRLFAVLQIIHQGFWLGVLDRESLQYITQRVYANCRSFQTPDYNLSGLQYWERDIVDRFFSNCRSVLVGAAGGGREIIALSKLDIRVDGFDCSPELVESGRGLLVSEGIESKIILSSPDQVPEEFGIYDGLIVGWGGYTHIFGSETRIEFLKEFHRHVCLGGPVLLSFFNFSTESLRYRLIFAIARFTRFLCRSRTKAELGDNLPGTFSRHFTKEQIERELKDGGFQLEYHSEGDCGVAVGRAI